VSALVQNKDQKLVADMSAGNDIYVKEGPGQPLLAHQKQKKKT